MAKFKLGDRIRVKNHKDWPSPPGFRFANAEGTVVNWVEYEEPMEGFKEDYTYVHIDKAHGEGKTYIGNNMAFRTEDLEKVDSNQPARAKPRQKPSKAIGKAKQKIVTKSKNLEHLIHDFGI